MISKIKEDESDAFILVNCIKRRKGFLNQFHNKTVNRSIEYARNTKIHFLQGFGLLVVVSNENLTKICLFHCRHFRHNSLS